MNDVQIKILVWGSIVFIIAFLFPPHQAIYLDGTSVRFLFSEPNDAYQMAVGRWIFTLIFILILIYSSISIAGQRNKDKD